MARWFIFSHIPLNCRIHLCHISNKDIKFTAYDPKLQIDRIGHVGVPGRFPGLIIGTANFSNSQFYFYLFKMCPATVINLKFG